MAGKVLGNYFCSISIRTNFK